MTGAPLVVITAGHGGDAGEEPGTLTALRDELEARGLTPDIRAVRGHPADRRPDRPRPAARRARHLPPRHGRRRPSGHDGRARDPRERLPRAAVPHGYRRPEGGVRTIGAGFAPTDEGRAALHVAARLARSAGARLRAITVLSPDRAAEQSPGLLAAQHQDVDPAEAGAARERLHEAAELREALAAVGQGIDTEVDVLFNDPADGLLAASRHVDLLVVGSRALGARRAVILGSVSRKVAEGRTARSSCCRRLAGGRRRAAGPRRARHAQIAATSVAGAPSAICAALGRTRARSDEMWTAAEVSGAAKIRPIVPNSAPPARPSLSPWFTMTKMPAPWLLRSFRRQM